MKKRHLKNLFSSLILFPILFLIINIGESFAETLPNILYILTDDLGYGDLSIYNPESKIPTPHMDQLALEGMRFTDAHSTSSVCTPSRYSILTGRYPWRLKYPMKVLDGFDSSLIAPNLPTVASYLKSKSYTTAVIGKWHLGLNWVKKQNLLSSINYSKRVEGGPLALGFDYSYFIAASLDMPPYCYLENDKVTEEPTVFTDGHMMNYLNHKPPLPRPKINFQGPFLIFKRPLEETLMMAS